MNSCHTFESHADYNTCTPHRSFCGLTATLKQQHMATINTESVVSGNAVQACRSLRTSGNNYRNSPVVGCEVQFGSFQKLNFPDRTNTSTVTQVRLIRRVSADTLSVNQLLTAGNSRCISNDRLVLKGLPWIPPLIRNDENQYRKASGGKSSELRSVFQRQVC